MVTMITYMIPQEREEKTKRIIAQSTTSRHDQRGKKKTILQYGRRGEQTSSHGTMFIYQTYPSFVKQDYCSQAARRIACKILHSISHHSLLTDPKSCRLLSDIPSASSPLPVELVSPWSSESESAMENCMRRNTSKTFEREKRAVQQRIDDTSRYIYTYMSDVGGQSSSR